jgi:hypothetical protein
MCVCAYMSQIRYPGLFDMYVCVYACVCVFMCVVLLLVADLAAESKILTDLLGTRQVDLAESYPGSVCVCVFVVCVCVCVCVFVCVCVCSFT